ncbi:hypothetical protein Pint_20784 [Pistacia integerrima]|uniref:Uncharacterized protein n=1 Tax=Pistacia integerrima TaxID=434235 RepID=A0ACC0XAI6_9ROSI|nr:hypothetical protein Pint_20784 [Pistacia integerrima]
MLEVMVDVVVVMEVVDIAFDAVAMVVDFVEDFGAAMTKKLKLNKTWWKLFNVSILFGWRNLGFLG